MIPVYSISKPFLAEAILSLGLPLDAPVGTWLKELPEVFGSRLIGELLNHTSGLDDYSQLAAYGAAVDAREPAWSRSELLQRAQQLPHLRQGFHYSNIGYLLLRMLLEAQTGETYFASLEQLVFGPLGIKNFTEWENIGAFDSGPLVNYDPKWVYSGTFLCDPDQIAPAMAKLADRRRQTIGHAAGWVPVPYPNTGFDEPGYGYGFMGPRDHSVVGHGGGGPGYGLMVLGVPGTEKFSLEYTEGDGFDQTAAILRMRAQLGV